MAFDRRGNRWVDSRLVSEEKTVEPAKVVNVGSAEFHRLTERLADEGRQGGVALRGDILMSVDDAPVRIKGPRE